MNFLKAIVHNFMSNRDTYHKSFDKTCIVLIICFTVLLQSGISLLLSVGEDKLMMLKFFYLTNIAVCLLSPFLYKFTQGYKLVGNLILSYSLAAITYCVIHSNGINSPLIFWLMAPVVLSAILFRFKIVIFWSTLSLVIFTYFLYQEIFSKSLDSISDLNILQGLQRHAFLQLFIFILALVLILLTKTHNRIKWLNDGNEQVGSLIQILSHDIINPLNLILGFGELIKEDTQEKELADGILRAAHQIKEIINHVKEMQALETGKKNFTLIPINLTSALENISFVFKDKIEQKSINLIVKNEISKDTKVLAEPVSFSHQVLNNLVSNAIKFTPENGEIIIHAYLKSKQVHINIQDTGIGIPENLISSLFRFDTVTSRNGTNGERGTGFGLPLVKKYIELYKGEIHVESIVSVNSSDVHGTNFHLVLNCA
ncbi:hypothetical protein A9Q84_12040 [Halobacteriovorax marinus]|uniref:histidine kinase n=1 Tax=Halobacteriovorax marinus TaxID=97084 RepID=A0A1Y5F8H4_9BACT|nr:hypothetical protein A9Q84_12040 [Halobacteriovorax marinus]